MSFNENGQNENQNWKIQNQTQHTNDSNIQRQSATIHLDGPFNATSEVVGNKRNSNPGDANVRSGVTSTLRTDFSGLFASKLSCLIQTFSRLVKCIIRWGQK